MTQAGYDDLVSEVETLLAGERDHVANLANVAAAIFHALPELNWAGFYRVDGDELVLGPFQGKPACVRMRLHPPGPRGVCATAAVERRTVLVDDVHAFPGHVACDAASNAELVAPITVGGKVVAVLDLDSPVPAVSPRRTSAAARRSRPCSPGVGRIKGRCWPAR